MDIVDLLRNNGYLVTEGKEDTLELIERSEDKKYVQELRRRQVERTKMYKNKIKKIPINFYV